MRTIEQTASIRTRKPDSVLIGRKSLPTDLVIEMDDFRCNFAAMEMEDPRCKGLRGGAAIEMDDPRCKGLLNPVVLEIEDPRCNRAAIKTEDPRSKGLLMTW